ncbi:CYTH and CHAD domain-containing protein [Sinomonas atrocyanea]|uniref:CYTH and CHAD domain-containing protein n=1 Tax=Sinomonas atrocyanea TaxID=37927 RepID=UPI002863D05C|nr:CYTH and CHAD domain-containing protein [Sinomonas atrocyanea]MDR6622391.1 CHAD domain-containing protein [Sinomonas atrocyanea]
MAGQDSLEVERKYSVDADTPVPSLAGLPGVERISTPQTRLLDAVYFDTQDFVLARHRITLRRRTGGPDAGWHLKLPADSGARQELHEPLRLDTATVPDRFRGLVGAHTRGAGLVPIARLSTRRTATELFDAAGGVLAEFSDDHVESQVPPGIGPGQRWREWELELVTGSEDLLEAADELLAADGIHPAALPSKLVRALGPALQHPSEQQAGPERKGEAGVVLVAYVRRHAEALLAHDPGVRLDAPDAVHQLRVSARRMRSALASFRKFVDADAANRLRDELQWLAGTVGQARDVEVMRGRLTALAGDQPQALLLGPVVRRIEEESDFRYRQAHDAGLVALDSERYFRLLDSLDAFLDAPPLVDRGRKPARKAVARRLAKDVGRLQDAVRAAEELEDADSLDVDALDAALHEVRKSAKRLRYAGEAAEPVLGKRAKKLAASAERLQDTLGELQDTVVSRAHLLELAAAAQADGESAFSFGRLHALEELRAAEARAGFRREWTRFLDDHA